MNKLKTYNKMKSTFQSNREKDFDSFFREEIIDSYIFSREIVNNIGSTTKGKKRKRVVANEKNL